MVDYTALLAIGSVIVVSLISLVGLFTLSIRADILKRYVFVLVSLAVGALFGDAFIHLIPEALEESSNTLFVSLSVITGIIIFFILEKVLHWHHHGGEEPFTEEGKSHPVGKLVLISDGMHNFIDGLIIGASYLVSIPAGIATTVAVVLHEIPQEMGDFGVLLHAGFSRMRALWLNFLTALSALAGVLLVLVLKEKAEIVVSALVPLAAGGFIYIAAADLVPELHKHKSFLVSLVQIVFVVIGVALMAGLLFLE